MFSSSPKNGGGERRSRLLDPLAGARLCPDSPRSGDRRRDRALEIEGRGIKAVGSLLPLLEEATSGVASGVSSSGCADHDLLPVSNASS